MPTFEMTAYTTIKDGRHRIAWSATKTSVRYPPMLLTRNFIKALKKARCENDSRRKEHRLTALAVVGKPLTSR
jgi:hypothetical protein